MALCELHRRLRVLRKHRQGHGGHASRSCDAGVQKTLKRVRMSQAWWQALHEPCKSCLQVNAEGAVEFRGLLNRRGIRAHATETSPTAQRLDDMSLSCDPAPKSAHAVGALVNDG
eukprot:9162562-Pyramimonas_sp.AAC.2